jgi:dUTP pyrophosphatase
MPDPNPNGDSQLREEVLRVRRIRDSASLPVRAEPGSVGYDLFADLGGEGEYRVVLCGQVSTFPTGIAVAVPEGCYGRVAPRSGLASRHGIDVLGGVIDPSYRGEVFVVLACHGDARTVRHGDRIAQLVLERCATPEVEEVADLGETARGAAGLGSSCA